MSPVPDNNTPAQPAVLLGKTTASQPKKVSKPLVVTPEAAWKKPMAVCLALVAGVLLIVQGGINTNLKNGISDGKYPTAAACVSFSVGSLFTTVLSFIVMPRIGPTTMRQCPWYGVGGGFLGPFYVTGAILLISRLGFAVFQLCAIIGLLLCSITLDSIGFLFLPKKKLILRKVFAILILIVGAVLTTSNLDTNGQETWAVLLMCVGAACVGTVFPIQGCLNGVLVQHILSPFRAVGFTFGFAATLLATATVILAVATGEPFILEFEASEFWMFLGGACGGALVTCNAVGIPILGAAAFTTLFLSTQLVAAVICDATGAFGMPSKPITPLRLIGVLVAVCGAGLFQFNITFCPNYEPPPPPPNAGSMRASTRAANNVAHAARSSIKFTADEDEGLEEAGEEEKATHMKRQSVRLGAS